ncbi:DNA adenine methylase [Winogradskyella aurantiaca]|uniref:DNA adenine methylase n=1 Tax=Winogradskyella aurantiaca TaxID=2219558 RepID=UPI000E1DDF5D|nr:DNA adenine methylase [Winogradskyella aurantiaca]
MKYMGSKSRFAKDLLPILLKDRENDQYYVEPFAGGMNMMDKVSGNRIANDAHQELMAMWCALIYDNWNPPSFVSEALYLDMRDNPEAFKSYERGYVGFNSYAGKWFAGYRRDKEGKRDYWREHYNNIKRQIPFLKGVELRNQSYLELDIPENSIIYCDPPYEATTSYRSGFDHVKFWEWCREKSKEGHQVFISEYRAPGDFYCVWERDAKSTFSYNGTSGGTKESKERLFVYQP